MLEMRNDVVLAQEVAAFRQRFEHAMNDDLNTLKALSVLFEIARAVKPSSQTPRAQALGALLRDLGRVLGLLSARPTDFLTHGQTVEAAQTTDSRFEAECAALMQAREHARANRDWAEADRIRALLQQKGVLLSDGSVKNM